MLTEDHIMLRESMSGFLSQLKTIKSLREMLSSGVSMQADTWKSLSEMGWTGLLIDEEFGGSNLGLVSACLMAENVGRSLLLSPIISSALLSSFAINLLGTHNQKNHLHKQQGRPTRCQDQTIVQGIEKVKSGETRGGQNEHG